MRSLPKVTSVIYDESVLPEGQGTLACGIVLASTKGTIGEAVLINSPQDLLTTYTFAGTVKPSDDKGFHTAIRILKQTNQLYVSRAASNALYGGLIVKKEDLLGSITAITTGKNIVVTGDCTSLISATDTVRVSGVSTALDGRYTVVSSSYSNPSTTIVVSETVSANYTYTTGTQPKAYKTRQPIPFNQQLLGAITDVSTGSKTFSLAGDLTNFFPEGDQILVAQSTGNNGTYTVVSADYVNSLSKTVVTVSETVSSSVADGNIYRSSIVDPDNYEFQDEDLFILTGVDQGAYNGDIEVSITSYTESPNSLTEVNTFEISIYDSITNEQLELSYLVNRDPETRATDGTSLYIEDVLANSAYVRVVDNTAISDSELPCNTLSNVQMSGGSDGDTLVDADYVAALSVFEDKVIPIDIFANGSIETATYQSAMVALAELRKDIFPFLNSRLTDERASTKSARATNVKNYKKDDVASTSYLSAMYAPHITIPDVFNSRNIEVGADAVVIPGWLSVINNQGYPYAFAGPRYGTISGITTAWKIGDESGEATTLNDASVNVIAYDPIQGRYYAQTQNTLQIANSAMRDIGVVLNVLDIKKTLSIYLKEYLQLPITTALRREITGKVINYMDGIKSANRVSSYAFNDVTTLTDIDNDTLVFELVIAPTKYAQHIRLVIRIVNQTFDFQILQAV